MKKAFKLALMCAMALMTAAATTSCEGGEEETGGELENSRLIGKWEVAENPLGIVSGEFGVSGNYIIVFEADALTRAEGDLVPLFGTYRIDGDRVELSGGLGTMTIKSLDGNALTFDLQPGDSDGMVALSADKAPEMPASTKTDLLCRTWQNGAFQVYFSKAGTYLISRPGEIELSNWKWKSESEGTAYYSFDFPPVWSDDDTITFEELTENTLVVYEEYEDGSYDRITLSPVK